MKPFYQGKVDVFCAIYAVLNGLKVTHQIRTMQARTIFHETLMGLAHNPRLLLTVLEQQTDYVPFVDAILRVQCQKYPLAVENPFPDSSALYAPSCHEVWDVVENWLYPPDDFTEHARKIENVPSRRAAIFRFLRYTSPDAEPVNKHWTTTYIMQNECMDFFDCSLEEGGVYSFHKGGFVTRPQDIDEDHLCCLEPHSIRLLRATENQQEQQEQQGQ